MTPAEKEVMRSVLKQYFDPTAPPRNKDKPRWAHLEKIGLNAIAIVLDELFERKPGTTSFLLQTGRIEMALTAPEKKTSG